MSSAPESHRTSVKECTAWGFAAILGAILFASFPQVVLGFQTFFFRDFASYSYPVASFVRDSFWRGEIPFWNPLNHCGVPFLAQWSTLVFYPLSLIYILFPLSWSLGFFCLLHLFIAGLGMFLLARRWIGSSWPAAIAGLCFALNGMSLSFMMWPHVMAVMAWMPWLILLSERACLEGGRWRVAAAVVGTLQMLAGVPEFIFQTWVLISMVAAFNAVRHRASWRQILVRLLVLILLIAGLCAFQLLPFFDFLQHSQRGPGFDDGAWAMPGTGWANLIVPLFNCYRWASGVFHQLNQWFVSSYYLGIIALALAIVGWTSARSSRARLLGVVALAGLVLAVGDAGYVLPLLRKLCPALGFMRFPIKFVFVTGFCVPLLAGYGARYCLESPRAGQRRLWAVAGVLLVLAALIVWFAHGHPLPWEVWGDTLNSGVSRMMFLLGGLCLIGLGARFTSGRYAWCFPLLLLVVLWMDIRTHTPEQNPTIPRYAYDPGIVAAGMKNPPRLGESRLAIGTSVRRVIHRTLSTNHLENVMMHRLAGFANANILDDLPKTDGFFSLTLGPENELESRIQGLPENVQTTLAEFQGVCQFTRPGTLFTWHEQTNHMPMISSGQRPEFVADDQSLKAVTSPAFSPRTRVILPEAARGLIAATNGVTATISSLRAGYQRMDFNASAAAPAIITIAQSYYHPWHAWVDGKPTRIWRANHAYQALEVPAGNHSVELVYVDVRFRLGCVISCCSLLALVVIWRRSSQNRVTA